MPRTPRGRLLALQGNPCNEHYLGKLKKPCKKCGALHFNSEKPGSWCCSQGKISWNDCEVTKFRKKMFKCYGHLENIRSDNAALAMGSTNAESEELSSAGPYSHRIRGEVDHDRRNLIVKSNESPKYGQQYLPDANDAVQVGMSTDLNLGCNTTTMTTFTRHISEINPYVQSLKKDGEQMTLVNEKNFITLAINNGSQDKRSTVTNAAVSFPGKLVGERNFISCKNDDSVERVSVDEPNLDPSYGEEKMTSPRGSARKQISTKLPIVSKIEYASFLLAIRPKYSILHNSGRPFQQWIVDQYKRIEEDKLNNIRTNQDSIRLNLNRSHYMTSRVTKGNSLERKIELPGSFAGSRKNKYKNWQNALAIVKNVGTPDLFITVTCNPKWKEIEDNLEGKQQACFRPDLVVRVFREKLKAITNDIRMKKIFGKVEAMIYTVEFQKGGLPHCHMLITLGDDYKLIEPESIDRAVQAEIPDQLVDPTMYELVKTHMIHIPCGDLNPRLPCMVNGKCSYKYPKDFNSSTFIQTSNGSPIYRRRDNKACIDFLDYSVDNRNVVPYNRYLLKKYNCHCNVELVSKKKAVKYLYKYIYKAHKTSSTDVFTSQDHNDEIESYLSTRRLLPYEAAYKIFRYKLQYQSVPVEMLDYALENQQEYKYKYKKQKIENPRKTKLEAWFRLNGSDLSAKKYLYTQIPKYYTWENKSTSWLKRKKEYNTIGRMIPAGPEDHELFYFQLLLLHVKGAESFEDVRIVDGQIYPSFREAAFARGIADNYQEFRQAMLDAVATKLPGQIRHLFANICAKSNISDPLSIWNEFNDHMIENFSQSDSDKRNSALIEINKMLRTYNTSCQQVGLPVPLCDPRRYETSSPAEQDKIISKNEANSIILKKEVLDTGLSVNKSSNDNDIQFKQPEELVDRAISAPTNEDCAQSNNNILTNLDDCKKNIL